MSTEQLEIIRDGGIARLTLRRGERNLIDASLTRELADALHRLDADESVTALVLTGAGEAFCGGADGPHIRETGTAGPFADAAVDLFATLAETRLPVIAAANGDALAGGFGLVCSADIVIAAEAASFGTIEASLGTWPTIAQVPASRRVPPKAALRNALTGVPFSSAEALALGIVDEVLPTGEEVLARAEEIARQVGRGNRAVALGRPLLTALLSGPDYHAELERGAEGFIELFGG